MNAMFILQQVIDRMKELPLLSFVWFIVCEKAYDSLNSLAG
jgi:hypothetical protein